MSGNWKKWGGFLGLIALLGTAACVNAEERAATSSLPAALTSIGIAADDVVSTSAAHQVRGQGGINHGNVDWLKCYWGRGTHGGFPYHAKCDGNGGYDGGNGGHDGGNGGQNGGSGCGNGGHNGGGGKGYTLTQTKDFSITNGTAKGTVNMMEGVIGTFTVKQVRDGQTLEVNAAFGGLAGVIGLTDQGLQFQFAGKAFQESFDFTGTYNQNFSQSYTSGK